MGLFAVFRTRGAAWKQGVPLEGQEDWAGHAAFMDGLYAEGFALLVGPLEGSSDALIIIRANSPEDIEDRLLADPWSELGLLVTSRISPWTLRLGSVG